MDDQVCCEAVRRRRPQIDVDPSVGISDTMRYLISRGGTPSKISGIPEYLHLVRVWRKSSLLP